MTNVTRYGYRRTKGWKVRVRDYPQKLFSDGKYGGKTEAYRAAVEYLRPFPVEARTRTRFFRRHKHNKSGHIGVSEIVGRTGKTRGWRVVWCEPSGGGTSSFPDSGPARLRSVTPSHSASGS